MMIDTSTFGGVLTTVEQSTHITPVRPSQSVSSTCRQLGATIAISHNASHDATRFSDDHRTQPTDVRSRPDQSSFTIDGFTQSRSKTAPCSCSLLVPDPGRNGGEKQTPRAPQLASRGRWLTPPKVKSRPKSKATQCNATRPYEASLDAPVSRLKCRPSPGGHLSRLVCRMNGTDGATLRQQTWEGGSLTD
ncbi:hypothetical protein LZ31DRAFT_548951 [Colletotrichum somersetense]|nr:hypothetical protein LZ31DRAFT_548951 [Colletotrichum somersetense]